MLSIRPYFSTDYIKLLPYLQKFDSTIHIDTWKKLLNYEWENKLEYKGMLLESEGSIVGFISYILSSQEIDNKNMTICNISSWIVNPEFRSKSLQLLSPLFKIKDLVITNLSPHENTLSIFEALRFDSLSGYEYRINPFKLKLYSLNSKNKSIVSFKEINQLNLNTFSLESKTNKLITEHSIYTNVHFYCFSINKNDKSEKIILAFNQKGLETFGTKQKIMEIPYGLFNRSIKFELIYSSSCTILLEYFNEIMTEITNKKNARIIVVSEHFINKKNLNLPYLAKIKKDRPWYSYSDNNIKCFDINMLYSEKVLLNF